MTKNEITFPQSVLESRELNKLANAIQDMINDFICDTPALDAQIPTHLEDEEVDEAIGRMTEITTQNVFDIVMGKN